MVYSLSPLSHNLGFGAHGDGAGGGRRARHPRPAARREPGRPHHRDRHELPGRRADRMPSTCCAELRERGLQGLGRLTGFRISGAAVPSEVVARPDRAAASMPQSGYGMTETCSHQYTLPDDDAAADHRDLAAAPVRATSLRSSSRDDPDTEAAPGEIGQIGGRGASLMLGYFDDQAATEDGVQRARLVHDRRSRLDRRARLSAHHRPQEGRHHPRRPQHLSGAHRGARDAASGGRSAPPRCRSPTRGWAKRSVSPW